MTPESLLAIRRGVHNAMLSMQKLWDEQQDLSVMGPTQHMHQTWTHSLIGDSGQKTVPHAGCKWPVSARGQRARELSKQCSPCRPEGSPGRVQ